MRKRYSPERIGNELWRGVEQLSRASDDLPLALREVLDDLRGGHLTLRMTNEIATKNVDRAGRRIFSGLVAASLFVSGAYLLKGDARDARLGLRRLRRRRVRDALAPRRPREATHVTRPT